MGNRFFFLRERFFFARQRENSFFGVFLVFLLFFGGVFVLFGVFFVFRALARKFFLGFFSAPT